MLQLFALSFQLLDINLTSEHYKDLCPDVLLFWKTSFCPRHFCTRLSSLVDVSVDVEGCRWRYYFLQCLVIIYNGHCWSGIFSGKTEKMAAGCDDFWVIFGIFSQVCYPSLTYNGK